MDSDNCSFESSEDYDLGKDETQECIAETPYQLYSRILKDLKGDDLSKLLNVIAFVDTTFKAVAELVSSNVAIELREKGMAKGTEVNSFKKKEMAKANSSKDKEMSSFDPGLYSDRENLSRKTLPESLEQKLEEVIIHHLLSCTSVRGIVSQIKKEIIQGNVERGQYIAYINTLDSSMNASMGYPCGSIFSFVKYSEEKRKQRKLKLVEEDVNLPLNEVEFSGFAFYGFRTELVIALKDRGLQNFVLDSDIGLFTTTMPNIVIPRKAIFYSGDRTNSQKWPHQIRAFLDLSNLVTPLHYFWPGGFIQQLHGILQSGGIFFAPASMDLKAEIPVLSVAFSIALIMKEGGGTCFPINYGFREENFYQFRTKSAYETTGICFGSYKDAEYLKSIYLQKVNLDNKYFVNYFVIFKKCYIILLCSIILYRKKMQ